MNEQTWTECPHADRLLRYAARAGIDRRLLVGAAAAVARNVLPIFEDVRSDSRVRDCIDACDRYAAGEEIDLPPYADAAYVAAYDATLAGDYDAANAAYAAAHAAYARAFDAAHYAAYADARARHADIVRSMIKACP